jgi:ribulose-phosphate 3-epimerase
MVRPVRLIAASVLACDFSHLAEEVRAVEEAGVDWLHVDVMDGHFVPNLTIGPSVVEALHRCTRLPLDVHLMIENPERYLTDFARAGADYLSVHQEACPHLHAVVQEIRRLKMKPAVAINPATPLASVELVLPDVDMLLIMSVNPGFGGQKFIDSARAKLSEAARLKQERGLGFLIEVDGGVKPDNSEQIAAAGAEVFVSGTGIYGAKSYAEAVAEMRRAIETVR